ncbi:MAG TPA: HEAT repeat domain-containing protein [Methylococcus sp.]|nr:HEAT repeat domain-containing protein [Methylococcus sp.]
MTTESKSTAVPPPDYGLLAERLQALAQRQPTPEEWEEEREYNREQALALAPDLHDPSAEKRIETAEQLGAFPSEEAEVLLIETLAGDPDPDVRVAAVQSLENFEHLGDKAIAALLGALEDENEDVRMGTLTLLENLVSSEVQGSARYKKIVAGLKKKARSRNTPGETRRAIRAFLGDQAS